MHQFSGQLPADVVTAILLGGRASTIDRTTNHFARPNLLSVSAGGLN
jgi:hypothetical protein